MFSSLPITKTKKLPDRTRKALYEGAPAVAAKKTLVPVRLHEHPIDDGDREDRRE
jgi:hypothetical protein